MEASGAFKDIRSSIEGGHPEIQILFDQERASQLGLAVRDIADRVVSNVRGDVATRYRLQEKKIDVLVRSVDTRAASIEEVRNLVVNPGSDRPVPLSAVAEVRLATGPAEIRRANQERVAVISAAPVRGDLGEATVTAQEILAQTTLPVGIMGSVSGQSEEMTQSFRSLGLAFALAVFLVYLVMASQFESLLHPFVILFTIPMGLIGSVWGLYITGTTINSVALIGLIMLAGIVVNNAIVLIDAINQARERGLEKIEAIKLAGKTRLRPILITSVSTIIGLIPMAIGIGEGAEIRRPMAITVIAGNLVATFLTLIVIPVLYAVLDRKEYVKSRGRRNGRAAADYSGDAAAGAAPSRRAEAMVHTDFALRRPVTTLMAFAAVAVIGIVSSRLLPLEQYPDVSFPFMGAGVPYPGSTPEETEELITRPIEDALATLPGIEEIRSTSSDQDARFEIRFAWGTDINTAGFEVRNKLDSVRSQLPKTADRMWMWMASTADSPMLTVRFSADQDLSSQYDLLDRYFKKPIERLDGVARVELAGVEAREVRILVDPGRLAAHAVDIRQLVQLLEKSNFSVAAGQITGNGERLSVRPLGEFRSLDEIRNLVIKGNVHVGDVASVELVSPEITRRRHLDGRPAVGLDVFKSTQANVVEVVDRVLEVIEHNKALPQMQGIRVFTIDNQAEAIRTFVERSHRGRAHRRRARLRRVVPVPAALADHAHRQRLGAAVAAGDARGDVLRRAHHQRDVDDGHDAGHRHAGGQRRGGHRERVPPPAAGSRTIRRRRRSRASRKSASRRSPAPRTCVVVFLPILFGSSNQLSIWLTHAAIPDLRGHGRLADHRADADPDGDLALSRAAAARQQELDLAPAGSLHEDARLEHSSPRLDGIRAVRRARAHRGPHRAVEHLSRENSSSSIPARRMAAARYSSATTSRARIPSIAWKRRWKPSSGISKEAPRRTRHQECLLGLRPDERILHPRAQAARRGRAQGAGAHREGAGRAAGNHHRQTELQVGRRQFHGRPALQRAAHGRVHAKNSRSSATKSRA